MGTATASQVVEVVPTPSNAIQSGNDLLAAYNGIIGANTSNRYLVQLEPGVYDLGNQNLVMKEWVSLAGSGVDATLLRGNGNTAVDTVFRGLVEGASNAELRDLTIRVFPTSGRQYLVPIYLPNEVSPRIHDLRTQAFGAEEYCGGIFGLGTTSVIEDVAISSACPADAFGIVLQGTAFGANATTTIRRATVSAVSNFTKGFSAAAAILIDTAGYSSHTIEDVTAVARAVSASGLRVDVAESVRLNVTDSTLKAQSPTAITGVARGAFIQDGLAEVLHSRLSSQSANGTSIGFESSGPQEHRIENSLVSGATNTVSGQVLVGGSKLAGGPVTGSVTCAGVYDENFTFFSSSCP